MESKSKDTFRLLLGLFLAESICVSAFVLEISRALSGNELSWAYVFEWPILGTYAAYMWHKLSQYEASGPESVSSPTEDDESNDARLVAWNEYLAHVHSIDQSDHDQP